MEKYKLSNKIFAYDSFYNELSKILCNVNNKFCVTHHLPIGKSACGFPIEHYSIGYGDKHIVYMASAHGNEIIGVSYILEFMRNLALGHGVFQNFDEKKFTIDFLPCQNPEGYFVTTYALTSILEKMTEEEKNAFYKQYYADYRRENEKINKVNEIIRVCLSKEEESFILGSIRLFWATFAKKEIQAQDLVWFLVEKLHRKKEDTFEFVSSLWQKNLGSCKINTWEKSYQKPFLSLSIDCIPEKDEKHIRLKENLKKLYSRSDFPMCTLANFIANSEGINLNDNNPYYFKILNEQIKQEQVVYANPMYLYPKSKLGPIGTTSSSFTNFSYALENEALFRFIESLGDFCYAFFNLHGTGGLIYAEPFYEPANETERARDFSFYINNRIATEYLKEIEETYFLKTGKKESYFCMGHPKKITGTAEMLRANHIGHFLLELSKAGGNPLGPYIEPNYTLTMEANFRALMKILDVLIEVEHLYDKMYTVTYDEKGNVYYGEQVRKRIWKKDNR